jgi:predicted NUDIX family NTP pyrophosphohydrolase
MSGKIAAGLLMCRKTAGDLEFFLVHPGGPFFKNKDIWTIPKGLPEGDEALISVAQREFFEETGIKAGGPLHDIGHVRQKGGKIVNAWAFIGAWKPEDGITSNSFTMEWPPRSGKQVEFAEVDKASWMTYQEAVARIIPEQVPFLNRAKDIFGQQ